MAYVFGDTIVCANAQTANAITFGAKVRSATLAGDQYDPSGTLSGGAAPSGSGVLTRVQEVLVAERKAGEAQGRLRELERGEEVDTERREKWNSSKLNTILLTNTISHKSIQWSVYYLRLSTHQQSP